MKQIKTPIIGINQELFIPTLQERLDGEMQGRVVQHNALSAKVAHLVNISQRISLELLKNEGSGAFSELEAEYKSLLRNAKQLLPSSAKYIVPISSAKNPAREVNEKVQNQMEYLQLLCNNEQMKETNLLDLSLKNYFAISNTLCEIAKTLFGFIKHVLGNSTGR